MPYGYNGKILHVDLSTAAVAIEQPPEAFYRRYLGGSCLNLYYLLRQMPAAADPLGPDNILALSVSVVTGAPISGQSRMTATAKSPLTEAIGDTQAGGFWPAELKFAGFDAVVIKGRAPAPVYLWIDNGTCHIRPADHLWGKSTGEAERMIKEELDDPGVQVLQIGPAGENLVRYACLVNMCNRAAGRTGMGAVMGSKNLRAVVVRGRQRPRLADKDRLKKLAQWGARNFPSSMIAGTGKFGTAAAVASQQAAGGLPTRNFSSGVFADWQKIDGSTLYHDFLRGREKGKQHVWGRDTCFGCVVRCKRVVEVKGGALPVDPIYGGPEYETIATFGSYCGIGDLAAICKANELCNKYGLDTISCGATIAWAMEAFESSQLTSKDTGGLQLNFGNVAAMLQLTEMIAKRQGFGDLLAEGSARAAAKLGRGAEFLITAKRQEAPAHMPQVKKGLALIYAVNPFGADHMSSGHDPDYDDGWDYFAPRLRLLGLEPPVKPGAIDRRKVEFLRRSQYAHSLADSLCLCQFVYGPSWQLYGPKEIVDLVASVTGWDVSLAELLAVGERRVNMMRVFNGREGIGAADDQLADKFFDRPLRGGPSHGGKIDRDELAAATGEYYRQSGWDPATGLPTAATLERLALDWVVEYVKK